MPEKTCVEGRTEHCFCMAAPYQHLVMNHYDKQCCWCGADQCINGISESVPGHGPHRRVTKWLNE